MTERLSLNQLARVQQATTGFSARPAAPLSEAPAPDTGRPVHFSPNHPADRTGDRPFPDPEGDPLRAAWADGQRAGRAEVARFDLSDAAERLRGDVARIGQITDVLLAERLNLAVVALARQLFTEAPFDEVALKRRIGVALARLGDTPPLRCRCHPDAEPVARALLPSDVVIHVDPTLAPNALALDTATGGLADGPEEWAAALQAALAQC